MKYCNSLILISTIFMIGNSKLIKFGISINPNLPGQGSLHSELVTGLQYAIDIVNSFPDNQRYLTLDNQTFTLELQVMNHTTNKSIFMSNYEAMAKDSSIDYVLGPPPSPTFWATDAMELVKNYGRKVIFSPVESIDIWYNIGGIGAPTATEYLMLSSIPYLVNVGVKNITIISADEDFQRESCAGLSKQLKYNKINVVEYQSVIHANVLSDLLVSNLTFSLNRAMDVGSDVLVLCMHRPSLEWSMSYLRDSNYAPKAVMTSTFFQSFDDPSLAYYIMSFTNMPPEDVGFPEVAKWGSLGKFYEAYRNINTVNPGTMSIYAMLTIQSFYEAFMSAKSSNDSSVHTSIYRSNFDSIVGPVQYVANGKNRLEAVLIQKTAASEIVVATSGLLIYPFPKWHLREIKSQWGNVADLIGVSVIGTTTTILVFGVLPGLLCVWKTPAAKVSSRTFLLISLFGCIITELGLLAWLPGLTSDASCKARVLVIGPAAVLVLGSLILKDWRIAEIFNIKDLRIFRISDQKLALILFGIILFVYIPSILMVAVGNITLLVNSPSEYEPALNYLSCQTGDKFEIFRIIGLVIGGIIIISGIYIGSLRNKITEARSLKYEENSSLFYSVWIVLLVYTIVIITQYAVPVENQDVSSIVMVIVVSLGVLLLNGFVIGDIFIQSYKSISIIKPQAALPSGTLGRSSDKKNNTATFSGLASNIIKKNSIDKV